MAWSIRIRPTTFNDVARVKQKPCFDHNNHGIHRAAINIIYPNGWRRRVALLCGSRVRACALCTCLCCGMAAANILLHNSTHISLYRTQYRMYLYMCCAWIWETEEKKRAMKTCFRATWTTIHTRTNHFGWLRSQVRFHGGGIMIENSIIVSCKCRLS